MEALLTSRPVDPPSLLSCGGGEGDCGGEGDGDGDDDSGSGDGDGGGRKSDGGGGEGEGDSGGGEGDGGIFLHQRLRHRGEIRLHGCVRYWPQETIIARRA
jgi:hypothetical protein